MNGHRILDRVVDLDGIIAVRRLSIRFSSAAATYAQILPTPGDKHAIIILAIEGHITTGGTLNFAKDAVPNGIIPQADCMVTNAVSIVAAGSDQIWTVTLPTGFIAMGSSVGAGMFRALEDMPIFANCTGGLIGNLTITYAVVRIEM